MSTTAKGDEFEQRVHKALSEELQNERLCASPKHTKLYRRKAYPSRDRGDKIITDISLEVFLPDRDRPSLVWVFECKDYSGSVPVSDIEEFHSKLQQIGEDNTKGTFVTSAALQRSAVSYARSKGIGVIRLLPSGQLVVLIEFLSIDSMEHASQVDWSEFDAALTTPGHRSKRTFFCMDGEYWYASWHSLLSKGIGVKSGVR